MNVLKSIGLYILNEWIGWYVNYISIELLQKNKTKTTKQIPLYQVKKLNIYCICFYSCCLLISADTGFSFTVVIWNFRSKKSYLIKLVSNMKKNITVESEVWETSGVLLELICFRTEPFSSVYSFINFFTVLSTYHASGICWLPFLELTIYRDRRQG